MKTTTTLLIIAILAMLLAGCQQRPTEDDGTIKIVATTGMITDIVGNIGGDHVTVEGLMGPGVDPHLYKASAGDVRKLSEAELIFYNGLHLEAAMGEVLEQMEGRAFAVAENIPEEELLAFAGYPGQHDPHVWFDVQHWMEATQRVTETLQQHDPANAGDYGANAAAYLAQLEALDQYVKQRAEEVPKEQRVLVTAHDAFSYFGKAYDFEVKGLQGISTAAEAGTADVQELVNFIVERQIKAVFIESSVPERNIKAVQDAVRAQGWEVQIGGELFSDAMGDAGTVEGTYIGMVRHNIDTIAEALK